MLQERIVYAKTEQEARERVAPLFNVSADKLGCEMTKPAKKGILGFGAQDAEYRVTYDDGKPSAKEAEAVKAPREPEKKQTKHSEQRAERPERQERPERPEKNREKTEKAEKTEKCAPATGDLAPILSFIDMILADLKLDAKAKIVKEDAEDVFIEVVGDNLGVIIGHHGEVLDSIQYLANIVCDNEKADGRRLHVDAENYRSRREETLNKLADRMAKKVLTTGRSVTLEPMNPYERRIIHSRIVGINGVTTRSVGTDLGRKVVISPDRGEGGSRKDDGKYKVERPESAEQDGYNDRYTAPGK